MEFANTNNPCKLNNKKALLKDLLLGRCVLSLPKLSASKQITSTQYYDNEGVNKNGEEVTVFEFIINNYCVICNNEDNKKEEGGNILRSLRQRERSLLSLKESDISLFLCPFCSAQFEKLVQIEKEMERMKQGFDDILTVMKTVMKIKSKRIIMTTNFQTDEREDSGDPETEEFTPLMDITVNSICSFDERLSFLKKEVEEILIEPEWTFEVNEKQESYDDAGSSVAQMPDRCSRVGSAIMRKEDSNSQTIRQSKSDNTTSSSLRKRKCRTNAERKTQIVYNSDGEKEIEFSTNVSNAEEPEYNNQDNETLEQMINCELCQISVLSLHSFKKHTNSWQHFVEEECKEATRKKLESNLDFFLCPNCQVPTESFPSLKELRDHYKDCHEKGYLSCKLCGKGSQQGWSGFRKHFQGERHLILKNSANLTEEEVKEKLPFGCSHCLQRFTNEKSLEKHENLHTKPKECKGVEGPTICDACGRSFATFHGLTMHRRAFHSEKVPEVPKKTGTSPSAIQPQIKCPKCPKHFQNRYQMTYHLRKVHLHKPTAGKYMCEECGAVLSTILSLKQHKRTVHENVKTEIKRVTCPVPSCCQREILFSRFYAHLEVKHFQESFEGGGRIQCPFECGARSRNEDEWVQHVNTCSEGRETGDPLPKCRKCNAIFPSHFSRLLHQLRIHPESSHVCEYCSLPFTTAMALKTFHLPSHPESKPHLCSKCGKSFRTLRYLTIHQRSVCNDDEEARAAFREKNDKKIALKKKWKPFKCPKCGKGFIEEQRMKKHFETCHFRSMNSGIFL